MFETAGLLRTLPRPSASLVWLVVLPLLWAAFAFVSAVFGVRRRDVRSVALVGSCGIVGLSPSSRQFALAVLESGRMLEQHVSNT